MKEPMFTDREWFEAKMFGQYEQRENREEVVVFRRVELCAYVTMMRQYIAAYRPILSETAEKEEKQLYTEPTKVELIFDRLKSAIAASESIPGIIAEIGAMLPEGYCVFHCGSQAEKDHTL